MTQAIPQMITQGQDPTDLVKKIAAVIQARQKGIQIEDAIEEIFAPENPPAGAEQQVEQPSVPSAPGAPAEGTPPPGGAPQGGAPDLQTLLAGLTAGGQPTGGVSTKQVTQAR
jgi:hypothetical protein